MNDLQVIALLYGFPLTAIAFYLMGHGIGRESEEIRWRIWRDAEWARGVRDIGLGPDVGDEN